MRIPKKQTAFANTFNYEHEQLKSSILDYVLAKLIATLQKVLCSLPKMTAVAQ